MQKFCGMHCGKGEILRPQAAQKTTGTDLSNRVLIDTMHTFQP